MCGRGISRVSALMVDVAHINRYIRVSLVTWPIDAELDASLEKSRPQNTNARQPRCAPCAHSPRQLWRLLTDLRPQGLSKPPRELSPRLGISLTQRSPYRLTFCRLTGARSARWRSRWELRQHACRFGAFSVCLDLWQASLSRPVLREPVLKSYRGASLLQILFSVLVFRRRLQMRYLRSS
jgi:hypothetical protein